MKHPPLPGPSDWSFELVERYHEVIRDTAKRFELDTYPNQLEVITAAVEPARLRTKPLIPRVCLIS